ncbi:tryptophanyl-tRNA synthetase [Campylobacter concisus]|uniref:tryptophanyl-tRNA synthetase n=1 Tax=Campylobacter concisus TaxID=199 RepID=UPI001883510C|nr:tryptophanyl-tRNA synthetase [Campylobacter concisus]MBE9852641.1 tryptophanyl-tRNA synthetase [Campylobacter concisus]
MKKIAYIVGTLVLIVACIFGLLFSPFGSKFIAGKIEKEALARGIDVKFKDFSLGFSTLNLEATVMNAINLKANGELSLLAQSINLNIDINADKAKASELGLKKDVALKANVAGKFSDFKLAATGTALGSNINLNANLKDYLPKALNLDAKNIELSEISALVQKPNLASGKLDLTSNMQEVDEKNKPIINAQILASNAAINKEILKNEFGLNLAKDISFKGGVNAKFANEKVSAKTLIIAPEATLKANETTYDLSSKNLKSDFLLNVPDLALLGKLLGEQLSGAVDASGEILMQENALKNLKADINGLGGKINANFDSKNLVLNAVNIKLKELLALALQPNYADGEINLNANFSGFDELKKLAGEAKFEIKNGLINNGLVKLKNAAKFELKGGAVAKGELVNFDANVLSDLGELKDVKGVYNLKNSQIFSKFALLINDPEKFKAVSGFEVSSKMALAGDVKVKESKIDELNLGGDVFAGKLNATIKNENLDLGLKEAQLGEILALSGNERLANAKANVQAKGQNIFSKNPSIAATIALNDGKFNAAALSKMLDKKFPENEKFSSNLSLDYKGDMAKFSGEFLSSLADIKGIDGSFDVGKSTLNLKLQAVVSELNKLAFLAGRELHGKFAALITANGKVDDLSVKATSDNLFKGKLEANYKGGTLDAVLKNFEVKGLTQTLALDHLYDGNGDAKFDYETKQRVGKFDILLKEGHLASTNLTNNIKTFTGKDITKEIYKDGKIYGDIKGDNVIFNVNLSSPKSDIKVTGGTYNTATKMLNAPLVCRLEKTDLNVQISGTTDNLKYDVRSQYLENKVKKEIGRFLDKKLGKDDEGTSGEKQNLKGLLKGLF